MQIPIKTYLESIPGFFGIRTEEEPDFQVVHKGENGFEVRRYVTTVQAQTVVEGDRDAAVDEGFRRLAGYIFGENSGQRKLSMTTPVLQGPESGIKMPMTTPVLQEPTNGAWTISFVLPAEISLAAAPEPLDHRVKVVSVASKTVAVLRYSGNNTKVRMKNKARELQELIDQAGFSATSEVFWAQYDQPFAIPLFKRNEAQVEVTRRN